VLVARRPHAKSAVTPSGSGSRRCAPAARRSRAWRASSRSTKDAIWRHWKDHVSANLKTSYLCGPATIESLREKAASEKGSVLDHLTTLRSILMGAIAASAEAQSAYTLSAVSGRLVEVLREIGKLTGEIDRLNPSINVTNNVAIFSSPAFTELQAGLIAIARNHPDARGEIVGLLRGLDAKLEPPAANPNGAAHAPVLIEGKVAHGA
jgi:hypothetical protein